jgi:hypothetical protein
MAYNTKYRLDFADVQGHKRRVEILKKDYGGGVLPMIGTDEPVVIEWKADDDFYEPLIGSTCTLNLMVTDDVTYDEFYLFDEKEYTVKVFYESSPGTYTLYWNGWIANDIYSEAITSTPYSITVNANDGLGTLEGYNTWIPAVGASQPTLWQFVYNNLAYIGLGFDIWISCDIRTSSSALWSNIFAAVTVKKETMFHDSYIIHNAKDVLRSILIGFNCKISQSYGRWVISNASSYGDQRIISGIQDGSLSGSGILAAKQGYLNTGSEDIKFEIYNAAGANTGGATANYLRIVPSYFKAINNNLTRVVRRPVKKYQEIVDISQKKLDLNNNASFEFGTENWIVDTGTIGTIGVPFAGLTALSFIEQTNNSATRTLKFHSNDSGAYMIQAGKYQFIFSIRLENQATTNREYWFVKLVGATSGSTWYWDNANKGWNAGTTIRWNTSEVTNQDKYQSFKYTIEAVPEYGLATIGMSVPYVNPVGSHVQTLIDNVALRYVDDEINQYETVYFIREQSGTFIASDVMEHEDIYQANIPADIFWGNFTNIDTYRRAQDTSNKTIEEIVTQQRLNDFREYCKTYEGDLSSASQYMVLSMMNKIWFDFNTFSETDSAIIDSMKFSVKSNEYSVICHIPNNYTDVANNYRVSYQE